MTEEAALSIDHIREAIFSLLDKGSLLSCRQVSSRWANFGSKELQKRITLKFAQVACCLEEKGTPSYFVSINSNKNAPLDLDHLTSVVNNSVMTAGGLPFTSFEFHCARNESPVHLLETFFESYGSEVKKLYLSGVCYPAHLEEFKSSILGRTPNLEHFVYHPRGPMDIFSSSDPRTIWGSCEDGQEEEFLEDGVTDLELHHLKPAPFVTSLKLNLKYLEFIHSPPRRLFEDLLDASPNLSHVVLPTNDLHFLLVPTNRAHLLKTLTVLVGFHNKALEALVNLGDGNLNIKELRFFCLAKHLKVQPCPWVTHVFNQILEASSASCQLLRWFSVQFLNGIKFPPQKMPKVTQLELFFPCQCQLLTREHEINVWVDPDGDDVQILEVEEDNEEDLVASSPFFPLGTSLKDTFPNLRSVLIRTVGNCDCIPTNITQLFIHDTMEPLKSVKKVSSPLVQHDHFRGSFEAMFPNAVITNALSLT